MAKKIQSNHRFDEDEVNRWKALAKKQGRSLSGFLKTLANAAVEEDKLLTKKNKKNV